MTIDRSATVDPTEPRHHLVLVPGSDPAWFSSALEADTVAFKYLRATFIRVPAPVYGSVWVGDVLVNRWAPYETLR